MKYLFVLLILICGISSCSKEETASDEEEWGNNQNGTTKIAPSNIQRKTFSVNRQSFSAYFVNNKECKITDKLSSASGEIIIGTPSYEYKKKSDKEATLTINYTTKMYVGSGYTTTNCNYIYNLAFSSNNAGNASFTYKWVITMTVLGKLTTSTKNGSSSNTFTLK